MKTLWISAVAGALVGLGFAAPTAAQPSAGQSQTTPKGWNYEIKDGKRVPKGKRVVNADGSWREEIRVGKCVTIKEKSSAGEYRESRRCD
ncbi:MAG TPA: hypothetical protein VMK31_02305 [Sphingomicrobium sp.]|nr:hypothetical protein [Sphingomicrobium sp.]